MKKPVSEQDETSPAEITEGDELLEFYEFEDEEYLKDEIELPEDSSAPLETWQR